MSPYRDSVTVGAPARPAASLRTRLVCFFLGHRGSVMGDETHVWHECHSCGHREGHVARARPVSLPNGGPVDECDRIIRAYEERPS